MFGEVEYDPSRAYSFIPLLEQLETLGDAVRQGKIRHIGLSNETPWGLMEFLRLGKSLGCHRMPPLR
jgi:aryl-alcohol dehydrogenase-like predicted oxidoreductase